MCTYYHLHRISLPMFQNPESGPDTSVNCDHIEIHGSVFTEFTDLFTAQVSTPKFVASKSVTLSTTTYLMVGYLQRTPYP